MNRPAFLESSNRRPRLSPPTPDDIAAIWRRLSPRQQDATREAAAERGVTVEQHIRQRGEHVLGVLVTRKTQTA